MQTAQNISDIPELQEDTSRLQAEFYRDQVTTQEQMSQMTSMNTLLAGLHTLLQSPEFANLPIVQIFKDLFSNAEINNKSVAQEFSQGQYDMSGLKDLPSPQVTINLLEENMPLDDHSMLRENKAPETESRSQIDPVIPDPVIADPAISGMEAQDNGLTENTDSFFDKSFEVVIAAEGGYANISADRGGETYMGIARKYHEDLWQEYGDEFRSGNPSEEALDAVKERYIDQYWNKIDGIEDMNQAEAMVAFDTAVNHGTGTANRMIAETGGDVEQMLEARLDYYDQIIANDPSQKIFENGWNNRIANLGEEVRSLPAANDENYLQTAFNEARDYVPGQEPTPTDPGPGSTQDNTLNNSPALG